MLCGVHVVAAKVTVDPCDRGQYCDQDLTTADPNNCKWFYLCNNGFWVHQECAWGTSYDSVDLKCVTTSQARCAAPCPQFTGSTTPASTLTPGLAVRQTNSLYYKIVLLTLAWQSHSRLDDILRTSTERRVRNRKYNVFPFRSLWIAWLHCSIAVCRHCSMTAITASQTPQHLSAFQVQFYCKFGTQWRVPLFTRTCTYVRLSVRALLSEPKNSDPIASMDLP